MIDIHCHILPGLDDGPGNIDVSLAMAAAAAQDGIRAIIATPHTDGIRVNSISVEKGVRRLNEELRREKINIQIYSGYEIPSYLIPSLGQTHRLAGSNHILLEFPHTHLPADALITVSAAITRGLYPIIAHPERNPDILAEPELLMDLVAAGALVQLTAVSICGDLGSDIRQCSHYLLQKNLVHFIATDSHSPSFREPVLSRARNIAEKLVGREQAAMLVEHNPAGIIRKEERCGR
ncbi:MAG: CpsB/CapC family capsule biosynthesis tyrosine phosphatase [Desulfobulbaceae bacterium]|nr:CpsB/CapC family capsule biosynthesis tyrosine phosphatase [Desulfobulbaceae bacterium]